MLKASPLTQSVTFEKGEFKATTFSNHGKEAIVGIFRKGQFFGETCLGIAEVRSSSIITLEECLITSITKEAMLSMFNSEPNFSVFFMSQLLSRNALLEEDLVDQLFNLSERRWHGFS